MKANIIHNVDCLVGLCRLPDNCVDCCITSPPYFNMRDYGVSGQIGLEDTPEAYIHRLVEVFREVRRVLKPTGTLWVNIGDSYAGSGKGAANYPDSVSHTKQGTNRGMVGATATVKKFAGYKNKDLIIPLERENARSAKFGKNNDGVTVYHKRDKPQYAD